MNKFWQSLLEVVDRYGGGHRFHSICHELNHCKEHHGSDEVMAEADICVCGHSRGMHYGAERNFDGYFGLCKVGGARERCPCIGYKIAVDNTPQQLYTTEAFLCGKVCQKWETHDYLTAIHFANQAVYVLGYDSAVVYTPNMCSVPLYNAIRKATK